VFHREFSEDRGQSRNTDLATPRVVEAFVSNAELTLKAFGTNASTTPFDLCNLCESVAQ